MIYNLKHGKKRSEVGCSLEMRSDYGNALEEFLINASCQLNKNALDHGLVFTMVLDFFDSFTSSDSWIEQIKINIKNALIKQNKQNKKQQNKVG
jgi:hypothetical protein